MKTKTIAQILAQHVMRGWEDRWPLVTVICKCGDELSASDHRGVNLHLAVEELLARHQADVLRSALPDPGAAVAEALDEAASAWVWEKRPMYRQTKPAADWLRARAEAMRVGE